MKKLILILTVALTLLSPIYAKDESVDIVTATDSTTSPVKGRAHQVTFIFSSTFVGTIAGACFSGIVGQCAAGAPADSSLTITAPAGDVITDIPYTCTAGSVRILRTQ